MKIYAADTHFSKCVRERTNWECEKCNRSFIDHTVGLQCSHIVPREVYRTRFSGLNAQALCSTCHKWWHNRPHDSGLWIENLLGAGYMEILREQSRLGIKVPKSTWKDVAKHYREQHKIMLEKRKTGAMGIVDFESYV